MTPEDAAKEFGIVTKNNYLAHTIRAIEHYALKKNGKCYHIFTRVSQIKDKTKCEFFDRGCTIRLPIDAQEREDCEMRVRLAHELGHIIWAIDELGNPENLKDAEAEEEIFAWKFANALILCKSEHYQNEDYKSFVFTPAQVAATIQGIVIRNGDEQILDELGKTLPFVK